MDIFNFDKSVNQCSPVIGDVQRVVQHDEDGIEYVSYEPVDYRKIIASHGSINDWNLDTLLKAGINPNFSIHTGNPTRIEGIDAVSQFEAVADSLLADIEENK